MKIQKTLAEKLLDKQKIVYNYYEYEVENGFADGVQVAHFINKPCEMVFKTLITKGNKGVMVFVIPVAEHLDLKLAAKISGQKYTELLPIKDILPTTGYIKGGCSPLAMKKLYPTYIDITAENFDTIIFSAGKIGKQIEVNPKEVQKLTRCIFAKLTQEEIC